MEAALSSREQGGLTPLIKDRCETVARNGGIACAFPRQTTRLHEPVIYRLRFVVPRPPMRKERGIL
jgi:hypothetical protein